MCKTMTYMHFISFFHISSYFWFIDKEAEISFRLRGDMRWHNLKVAGKSGV